MQPPDGLPASQGGRGGEEQARGLPRHRFLCAPTSAAIPAARLGRKPTLVGKLLRSLLAAGKAAPHKRGAGDGGWARQARGKAPPPIAPRSICIDTHLTRARCALKCGQRYARSLLAAGGRTYGHARGGVGGWADNRGARPATYCPALQ